MPGQHPSGGLQSMAQHQCQISARRISGHGNILGPIALIHEIVPGLFRILHRGGERMLRGKAIFKAQGFPAGDVGELGGQGTGIAQVAAGIAAAVAVENDLVGIVAPFRLHPGGLHAR